MTSQPSVNNELSYEQAFLRVESILEQMNAHDIELEKALQLFEEADSLIRHCQQKLMQAEKRVEVILKGKNGDVQIAKDGKPMTQPFSE